MRSALAARDGDQPHARRDAGDLFVDLTELAIERAVHRVQNWCCTELAQRSGERARVVADDIELARALVAGQNMAEFRKQLCDAFARGLRVDPGDRRTGLGVSGGEDRYLVAGVAQGFGEQRDDRFDAAVAGRWHREPDRGQQRNPQTLGL